MEYQWRDIHADSSLESSLSSSDEAESVISSAAPFDDDDNSGREQEGDTERDGRDVPARRILRVRAV